MVRTSSLFAAIAVVAASGVIHGLLTDRWVLSAEPAASAAKLAGVALVLGDWEGKDLELDPQAQERAGITGFLYRNYENRKTRSQVQVFLVCARPGSAAVHTPEACYEGSGYKQVGLTVIREPVEASQKFRWAQFIKAEGDIPTDQLRIFWAWNADGRWQVPDNPRLAFARYKALFKLYVIYHPPALNQPLDKDPSRELLQLLLPELQRCLFPES